MIDVLSKRNTQSCPMHNEIAVLEFRTFILDDVSVLSIVYFYEHCPFVCCCFLKKKIKKSQMIQINSNCKKDFPVFSNILFFVYFKITYLSRKLPLNRIPR